MIIQLPDEILQKMEKALLSAGDKEIGGILMGEHLSTNIYCVKEITTQSKHGTIIKFIREVREIIMPLKRFFQNTSKNYKKYNYLGEWHSHPMFQLIPSSSDNELMWSIVEDSRVGANFAILLIVKLNNHNEVEIAAYVYLPNRITYSAVVEKKGNDEQ